MILINFETHPDLYLDFEKCLAFLREMHQKSWAYPDAITLFHVYTEFRNPKELMVVKSFLATQNLEKCRMVIWSDYDISTMPELVPYRDYLEFRVWDAREEAKGTILEDHPNLAYVDTKYYLQSDLLRLLVLYKYGGVWADMDIVFLQDMVPILDQEYMYQWGSIRPNSIDGACATMLSLKKRSQLASILLEMVAQTSPKVGLFKKNFCCWGTDMFARVYPKHKFTIFPSAFFNTEWQLNKYPGLSDLIEKSWFESPLFHRDYLFLEAFTWHWHNSSHKNDRIVPGSKFELLTQWVDQKLQDRGLA